VDKETFLYIYTLFKRVLNNINAERASNLNTTKYKQTTPERFTNKNLTLGENITMNYILDSAVYAGGKPVSRTSFLAPAVRGEFF